MSTAENPGALLHRNCPNCETDNSSATALDYSWQEWILRECAHCGFVYLENPPDYADFKVVFAWEKNHGDRKVRMRNEYPLAYEISRLWRKFYRWAVRKPDKLTNRIKAWVPPGLVIDVGCGNADRLLALPEDYETCGIEISEGLAQEAETLLATRGGKVINMPAVEGLASFESGAASGILMRSFLEHEQKPVELLAEAERVLKPGGVAIIKVPNFASMNRRVMGSRWCGFRFPGHVNHFTPASLKAMVVASGLTPVSFGPFDRFIFSDNMWMVVRKGG
tara:strand:+ start:3551 stop:4387 length:837 start_codon:yes stop_codon:yes gene_type:complete